VFDTAFFTRMPRVAAEYALAPSLGVDRGVRRYGFHGLAHESLWRKWCALYPQLPRGGRLITLQLGGGCSIVATSGGEAIDTSMGFSPLEGLVMTTRSGDLDAAAVPYLERVTGLSGDAIIEALEKKSGLAGMSGTDGDVRKLIDGPPAARFALELYCYRIRKYVGAYVAILGGCDGIVFGGGVGEHAPLVRANALQGLGFLGIGLDEALNAQALGSEARISGAGEVKIHVLHSEEESVLAAAGAAALSIK
jgi:acetate kinase